jgi:thioredoxin-like negative regulator of GroEL
MPSIDGKTKIASTPTTVIYKDNKIIDWFSGVKPASELKAKLDKILAE